MLVRRWVLEKLSKSRRVRICGSDVNRWYNEASKAKIAMATEGVAPAPGANSKRKGINMLSLSPEERMVVATLEDARWDFRTLEGIAKDTGLTKERIQQILESHAEIVRKSAIPDRLGRELYTLRSRPMKGRELFALVRTFVSKSVR